MVFKVNSSFLKYLGLLEALLSFFNISLEFFSFAEFTLDLIWEISSSASLRVSSFLLFILIVLIIDYPFGMSTDQRHYIRIFQDETQRKLFD